MTKFFSPILFFFLVLFFWWKVKSLSCVWLFATPQMVGSLPGSMIHGIFQARVGCHFLLQGIFLTQGSNPVLPFTVWATEKFLCLEAFPYSIEITQVFVLMPFWKIPEQQKAGLQMEKYKEKKNPIVMTVMIAVLKLHWSIKTFTAVSHM